MRGDLYRVRAARNTIGHEQQGHRYAVVVQADYLRLSTLLVAPTSTAAKAADFRPEIEIDGTKTRVLVEQTMAVDPSRLAAFAGRLDVDELQAVDDALLMVLSLR